MKAFIVLFRSFADDEFWIDMFQTTKYSLGEAQQYAEDHCPYKDMAEIVSFDDEFHANYVATYWPCMIIEDRQGIAPDYRDTVQYNHRGQYNGAVWYFLDSDGVGLAYPEGYRAGSTNK